MSFTAKGLATVIKQKMKPIADAEKPGDQNAGLDALAAAISEYILSNLEVKIPKGGVITTVTGGSGAPALGVANPTPISCEVS